MIDLEQKLGPFRLRAYGLMLNFLANILALYGLARVLSGTGGHGFLACGVIFTAICRADRHQKLSQVVFRDTDFPRNTLGKVVKAELVEQLALET